MNIILGLVFFLCLMFLTMIFGERLSLFGFKDWRWLSAPFDLAADFWDIICEAADRVWCFVFEHFWWVAATVSGGVGILLIAQIMVLGLSNEAHAVRLDQLAVMNTGSVLDQVPVLDTDQVLRTRVTRADAISQVVYQHPSPNQYDVPEAIAPAVVRDFNEPVDDVTDTNYPPSFDLPVEPRRSFSQPRLSITFGAPREESITKPGRPVRSLERSDRLDRMIRDTLSSLRSDSWQAFSDVRALSRDRDRRMSIGSVREDSARAVEDLRERVRVIPGDQVSSNSLSVRKVVPEDIGAGEFEIQIEITNDSRKQINGLIVRERLPIPWSPVAIDSNAVYRDSVVTWLVDRIEPFESETLTLRVESSDSGPFESVTEVSATAAVSSSAPAVRRRPQRRRDIELPPIDRKLPDVLVRLKETPQRVQTGEWVDVVFEISNVGDAAAEDVTLRVNLPFDLDHHDLDNTDVNRRVESQLQRLESGQRRTVRLTVQPTAAGEHNATVELLLGSRQLDRHRFDVVATEAPDRREPREFLPSRDDRL